MSFIKSTVNEPVFKGEMSSLIPSSISKQHTPIPNTNMPPTLPSSNTYQRHHADYTCNPAKSQARARIMQFNNN